MTVRWFAKHDFCCASDEALRKTSTAAAQLPNPHSRSTPITAMTIQRVLEPLGAGAGSAAGASDVE